MLKIIFQLPLFVFIFAIVGCETFTVKENKRRQEPIACSEKGAEHPKSCGYLSSGSTVKIDTGEEGRKSSVLEQLESTKQELTMAREKIASIENELENEKEVKAGLEAELEEAKKQIEATQQIIIENERVLKRLSESQEPYEKRIRELTLQLTKAQIAETKAKQELISLKIEQLMEKKKQKTQGSQ